MRIGAHVSSRGRGLPGAARSASALGADAVQVFASNPRGWAPPPASSFDRAAADAAAWRAAGARPLFFHAPYPLNVASANADFRARSIELGRMTAALAEAVGVEGLVIHAGSAGDATPRSEALSRAAATILAIAAGVERSRVLIELTAGGAGSVAATLAEARELFDACGDDPHLGLCLDTCHLFAAGYALDAPEGVAAAFGELHDLGLDRRLALVHANDSKGDRGSRLDRHADIGDGGIGVEGFRAILAQPAVRRATAVILETPGDDARRARDIALLKELASGP